MKAAKKDKERYEKEKAVWVDPVESEPSEPDSDSDSEPAPPTASSKKKRQLPSFVKQLGKDPVSDSDSD